MSVPLLITSLLLASASHCQDPIGTRNERALTVPFLRIPAFFNVLPERERRLERGLIVVNDIRNVPGPQPVREDHETVRLNVVYRIGLRDDSELAIESAIFSRGTGILDPAFDWWHYTILGWSDPLRDGTPFGRSEITAPGAGTFGSASGLGDTSFRYTRRLAPRYTAAVALKIPTGAANDLFGSGAIDAGFAISGLVPLRPRWNLYVQLGAVVQGRPTRLQGARGLIDQESLALTYVANSKDTWMLQWQSESSALDTGLAPSDAPHRIVTLGYRRRLNPNRELEVFVSEDRDVYRGHSPELANVGPDFTAGMRLSIKL